MEKRIKTLYSATIVAILAFLTMQGYWLYGRYEYSIREYEHRTEAVIQEVLADYNKARDKHSVGKISTTYSLKHDVDSTGNALRKVTVSTSVLDGRKLLGINENRNLTEDEMDRLADLVTDSLQFVEEKKLSVDTSTASSDAVAWAAMRNFELEIQSPFTVRGLDSLLKKENIEASLSLIVTDSIIWNPAMQGHGSLFNPHFQVTSPYSELERKAVLIDCAVPVAGVVKEMGWTLVMVLALSVFLILCLVWQIKTIAGISRLDNMRNSFVTTMIHELKRTVIFFLTDRTDKADRLHGFSLKGNDYIPKPFYPEELIAKINERFESMTADQNEEYRLGDTVFRPNLPSLCYRGETHSLSVRQSEILQMLARNIGNTVERDTILEKIWGDASYANSMALNVQITYIRRLIADPRVIITNIKKKGYVLSVNPE